jgi:NADH-quinone oxidoreductase subunit F
MMDILENMTNGTCQPHDLDLLLDLCESIKAGSLCALGQTAPNPVLTTAKYFPEEYQAHTKAKRCPSMACTNLTSFYILPDKCQGCGICLRECPAEAIIGGKRMVHVIDQVKCIKCGTCLDVCPAKFGAVLKVSGEEVIVPIEPTPVTALKPAKEAAITASENK